jgi:membrane protein implicated in regulation of membrane protease activity
MGLAYVFCLLVGLGILMVQAVLGSKDMEGGGADKDFHLEADHDVGFDAEADADLDADAEGELDGDHDQGDQHHGADKEHDFGIGGLVALFLSVRFWVFGALGFGLSGTLLTYLTSVGAVATFATAMILGIGSGLSAALAFRLLRRIASGAAEEASEAVGRVGRVIVPVDPAAKGKIRIELRGQSHDMVATTTGLRIERGDIVVIEDIEGEIAQVSRAPEELSGEPLALPRDPKG